jgi:hypothetical protein
MPGEPVLLDDRQPPDLVLLHEPEHVAIVGVETFQAQAQQAGRTTRRPS